MSYIKISELPEFSGDVSNSWIVLNNSNETETFKILRENFLLGSTNYTEITYSELYDLYTGSSLNPGNFYLITDFKTCYDQPDFDLNGNSITGETTYHISEIEPIFVLATSENSLAVDAYQPTYPNDKIKYDVTFNVTEMTGGEAYGRIVERIDEYGNRTDYDHRTILYKRYKTYFFDLTSPLSGTIQIDGTNVVGTNTYFLSSLSVGDVIYILTYDIHFKITSIVDDTNMTISGNETNIYESNLIYYYSDTWIDGLEVTIPYTHTRMTDPPVDTFSEAQISDFLMDGVITGGTPYFGLGSSYFTNLYPGLFVLGSSDISINTFTINGYLGADGYGDVDVYQYSTTGVTGYTAYAKRVWDAGDPTVNQIIIVDTDGTGIQQDYSLNTDDGYQKLYNLSAVTQIHYLVTSKSDNNKLSDEEVGLVVESYVQNIDLNSLSTTLSNLNSNYSAITNNFSSLYLFNDVEDGPNEFGGNIDDGGGDMYDGGNYILTDVLENNYDYRCYEYKNNNIIEDNDYYREFKTFQTDRELEEDGYVTSVDNFIDNNSIFYNTNLSHSDFLLANNVFGLYSYSNKIGDRSYNNSTYNWFNRNRIGNRFYNNRIYGGFYANVIGEYCYDNLFSSYVWRNNIGEEFRQNITGDDFQNNYIRNSFNNNYVIDQFYKNSIGNGFNSNLLFRDFYGNKIGNAYNNNSIYVTFYDNTIGEYFPSNQIGDYDNLGNFNFDNNTIGNSFNDNSIKFYFEDNQILNDFYSNSIYNNFRYNVISNEFNGNTIGSIDFIDSFNFEKNEIMNNFKGNLINANFVYNKLGSEFKGNETFYEFSFNNVGSYCGPNIFSGQTLFNDMGEFFFFNVTNGLFGNIIGVGFYENECYGTFEKNRIGTDFYNNTCNGTFSYNNIGNEFYENTIGDGFGYGYSTSQGNNIGNYFYLNTIGEYFYNNTIADGFYNNTVVDYFQLNDVKYSLTSTNFSASTHVYSGYNCTLFLNQIQTQRLSYYDGSDVLTITNITD